MVLLRPFARSLPLAARSFSSIAPATRSTSLKKASALSSSKLIPPSLYSPVSIRTLTTAAREKVKVLAVLYDGGQHAKDVRQTVPPNPESPPCV